MKFSFLVLGMGVFLLLLVLKGSQLDGNGVTVLPLLTLLIVCEFGFVSNAIGAFLGVKALRAEGLSVGPVIVTSMCVLLSVVFMFLGIRLWPL